jgi:hypothetical protein
MVGWRKLRIILDKVKVQVAFWTFNEDIIMKIYHKFSHQAGKKKLNKNLGIEISQSFGFFHIVQSRKKNLNKSKLLLKIEKINYYYHSTNSFNHVY